MRCLLPPRPPSTPPAPPPHPPPPRASENTGRGRGSPSALSPQLHCPAVVFTETLSFCIKPHLTCAVQNKKFGWVLFVSLSYFLALIVYEIRPQGTSDFNIPLGVSMRKGRYYLPHGQLRTLRPRKGKELEVRAPCLSKHGLREKVELRSPSKASPNSLSESTPQVLKRFSIPGLRAEEGALL